LFQYGNRSSLLGGYPIVDFLEACFLDSLVSVESTESEPTPEGADLFDLLAVSALGPDCNCFFRKFLLSVLNTLAVPIAIT
jgi:hypothetical protein